MNLEEFKNTLKRGNYSELKPLLRWEVRNKETLRDCDYYFPIIGDIVEVMTAYTKLDDDTQVTTIVPTTMVDIFCETTPNVYHEVRENTPTNFKIGRLFDMVENMILNKTKSLSYNTLDSIDTLIDSNNPFDSIIVVNIDTNTRVSILQYPKMLRDMYDKIGDYYIVPSSVYEVFIIPKNKLPDIHRMNEIIRQVNRTTVKACDVLSNKLLKYDDSGLSEC